MLFDKTVNYEGDIVKKVSVLRRREQRPLWDTLKNIEITRAIGWADRFDGYCALAAEWSVALALESAFKIEVSNRNQFIRTLHAEVNRLVYHTTYLSRVVASLRQHGLKQEVLLLREQVFNLTDELLGARVLPNAFIFGGSLRPLTVGETQKVRSFIKGWRFQWNRWLGFFNDPVVKSRLDGLLVVPPEVIEKWGWYGLVGKAAGISYDARKHRPYGAYPFLDFKIPEFTSSDAWARVQVVVAETELSLSLIEAVSLQFSSADDHSQAVPATLQGDDGFYRATVESAKGPFTAAVVLKDSKIDGIRIFSPGQRAWESFEPLLTGLRSDDLELAIASLGLDPQEAETL